MYRCGYGPTSRTHAERCRSTWHTRLNRPRLDKRTCEFVLVFFSIKRDFCSYITLVKITYNGILCPAFSMVTKAVSRTDLRKTFRRPVFLPPMAFPRLKN